MRLDVEAPANRGVLDYLSRPGKPPSPPLAPAEALATPRERFGSHPDIVEYLWDRIAPSLQVDCRAVVHGTPALVAPQRGVVFSPLHWGRSTACGSPPLSSRWLVRRVPKSCTTTGQPR